MAELVLGGRYQIVRHLARGGMAEVYLGHDQLLDRPVAVKIMFPELARDPSFVERFRREAQAAARLNHPNIVSVYDFGEDHDADPEVYFIVMEYIEGQTLSSVIRAEAPLPAGQAILIASDVAAGLAAAHESGIIHRDVKPANVLIAAGVAKVADFGIARAADGRADLTMPGAVIGTATYVSPEQAQGFAVDQRSDVYSLGMVIYEMLTGRPPFLSDREGSVAFKQQHEIPPAPSTFNPGVPAQLDAVVGRAMSLDPANRQASAEELRDELLAVDPDSIGEPPTVVVQPTEMLAAAAPSSASFGRASRDALAMRSVYRRRRAAALVLVGLLILGVIAGALSLTSGTKTATAAVPRVVGLSVPDAMAALTTAGLRSQVVTQSRAGTRDRVLEQMPLPGTRVGRNTVVSLIVPAATTTTRAVVPSTTPTTAKATTTTAKQPSTTRPPATTTPPTAKPTTTTAVPNTTTT